PSTLAVRSTRCVPAPLTHPPASGPVISPPSLHDALPISSAPPTVTLPLSVSQNRGIRLAAVVLPPPEGPTRATTCPGRTEKLTSDRKSTRLNSSHVSISYAVFCLKKKDEECILVPHGLRS